MNRMAVLVYHPHAQVGRTAASVAMEPTVVVKEVTGKLEEWVE